MAQFWLAGTWWLKIDKKLVFMNFLRPTGCKFWLLIWMRHNLFKRFHFLLLSLSFQLREICEIWTIFVYLLDFTNKDKQIIYLYTTKQSKLAAEFDIVLKDTWREKTKSPIISYPRHTHPRQTNKQIYLSMFSDYCNNNKKRKNNQTKFVLNEQKKNPHTIYYCKTCINICWNKEWKTISVLLPKKKQHPRFCHSFYHHLFWFLLKEFHWI